MNHVDNTKKFTAISTCTGMRGLERGIERAMGQELNIAAYVEIEAFIVENLIQQMEQGVLAPAPVWTDIKTFDARPFRGKVDILLGGYPCQPFSVAGERKGTDDPRHLFPYLYRIIEAARPVCCFFENVGGHLTLGFNEVYRSLRNLGYAVEAGLYSAAEVGAPHERERLFILAIKQGMGNTMYERWQKSRRLSGTDGLIKANPELGNASLNTSQGREKQQRLRGEFRGASNELAHTESGENDRGKSGESVSDENRDNKIQESGWESKQCGVIGTGELADTSKLGSETGISGQEQGQEGETGIIDYESNVDRWPAGQGQPQHEWEAPRTESGMGFTINGYNFREDLLRMAGNGVVEQTAEIAFIDLLNKHKSKQHE